MINLGVSADGSTDHLERMTAWRFMSPPSALLEGVSVGPDGTRIANEDLFGATHSQIMIDKHHGRGFLVLDANSWTKARRQIRVQTLTFQRIMAAYLFTAGHKKARTLKNSPAFPAPGLTLGGLRVNEDTGQVLSAADEPVAGLYAAGRTAVGICSNSYISGLSLADCIFSGRRAGLHAGSKSHAAA